ncbi:MAG: hypothetical protein IJ418_09270 [Clostridia bacterium]|nr:hypothetical protein [Clostridia bacterium]
MEVFVAFMVLMFFVIIRQEDLAAIREIEAEQENAPRKRRRMAYVDYHE